jgi:hypothetical protein
MQVFGGHGYIREWGMEQYVRDARINMIYEGTNTSSRSTCSAARCSATTARSCEVRQAGAGVHRGATARIEDMAEFVTPLADLGEKVEKLTMEIGMKAFQNQDEAGAAAVDYLRVIGHLVFAYFWARMARIALEDRRRRREGRSLLRRQAGTARFYFAKLLPETAYADPFRALWREERDGARGGAVLRDGDR